MPRVWLSLGSNIERERHIRGAVRALRAAYGELVLSRVYESEAVGFTGAPFYNMVVGLDTECTAGELNRRFRAIEAEHGRIRDGVKFTSRTLDIDLLTYGDRVIKEEGIELPRQEIVRYAFVLRPLAEVAGEEKHPLLGLTYGELWARAEWSDQSLWSVTLDLSP